MAAGLVGDVGENFQPTNWLQRASQLQLKRRGKCLHTDIDAESVKTILETELQI